MKKEYYINEQKIRRYKIATITLAILVPLVGFGVFFLERKHIMLNSNYSLLDPLRRFVPAENYLINIQDLREYLSKLGTQYPDTLSIYYETINSGANISVNKDLHLFPASLSKLVQAILVVHKIEKGELAWEQTLTATAEDLSSDSGTLYEKGVGTYTIETLLKELIVNSDNTAQNVFRRLLTFSDYVQFQNETGLQDLYNEKGFISAKEYTRIFRVLYTSSFLKPENSEKILKYMTRATFKDYLSQGIPESVLFAHKYGENEVEKIFADSGIVYIPGKPYMLTVIIKGKDSSTETRAWAMSLMKDISEQAYKASIRAK